MYQRDPSTRLKRFNLGRIPEAHTAAIAGHQRGERESYIRYAKKNDLKPLIAAIEAIDYGEIKIPVWPFDGGA